MPESRRYQDPGQLERNWGLRQGATAVTPANA